MTKAFLIDVDGTAVDTIKAVTYCLSHGVEDLGFSPLTEEDTKKSIGNGAVVMCYKALLIKGVDDKELAEKVYQRFLYYFKDYSAYKVKPFPGLPETFAKLKERGMKLALVSNKAQDGIEACAKACYPEGTFDVLYGEKEGRVLKPAPDPIYIVADMLGVKPEECVFVGDGEPDITAAKAAGSTSVAVSWGYTPVEELRNLGPDAIIYKAEELLNY